MTSKKEVWSTTEKRFVEIEIEGSREITEMASKEAKTFYYNGNPIKMDGGVKASKLEQAFVTFLREEYGEDTGEMYADGYILGDSKRMDDDWYAFKYAGKWLLSEAQALAFPQGTEDQVVRLSDLKRLVGEE